MNEAALVWHLTYNIYPPVTLKMIPYVEQAIRFLSRGTIEDEYLHYPDGSVEHASSLIDDLRLWDMVRREKEA